VVQGTYRCRRDMNAQVFHILDGVPALAGPDCHVDG
jgi:hypothetical protein